MLDINLGGKGIEELLIETEARLTFLNCKINPVKQEKLFNAIGFSLDQVHYAQHIFKLSQSVPATIVRHLGRDITLVDGKSKGSGE